MNRKELVKKINSLDALTTEEKSALIDLLKQKKYGLVWENKPENVEERLRAELPVLKEVKDKALLGGGEDAPNHILIEGDNLEALTALSYTHENSVDVIYIDPPYNTGNKDFVYNDSFVDAEDGYRHSKWLSFMDKRLRIAKRLLNDNGVIFISIDDNEQANLKLLCDDVFGSSNFVGNFVWVKKKKGSHLSKTLRSMTEYVLCYAKSYSNIELYGEDAYSDKQQPLAKRTNATKTLHFNANIVNTTLLDGEYEGRQGLGSSSSVFTKFCVRDGIIINDFNATGPYIWTQPKLDEEVKNGTKVYLSSKFGFNVLRSDQSEKVKRPSSLIDNKNEVGTNEDAYQEIIDIFGKEGIMSYPKPTSLMRYILKMRTYYKESSTILDFFAGSGTTLHATMQLNAEDGGHRKCILVTNNENNICEEVTYERNKRVINGYTTPKGEEVEGLKANNLRYYQIDHVERESSLTAKRKLMAASAELLCIKHDIYEESTTFGTLKLKPHIARYFTSTLRPAQGRRSSAQATGKKMLVIYMVEAIERIVEEIETMPEDTNIMVYVFSTNNYAMDADFEDVADKVTLCALPAAIYNAYLKVLPKKGEPKQIIEEDAE